MPLGFRKDGTKLGFQKGNKVNLGVIKGPHSEERKRKISEGNKGKIFSQLTRTRISIASKYKPKPERRGKNHWNWKGGIKPLNEIIRHSIEYRLWRESVFARDNWTCRFCGQRGEKLVADHIKQFAFYPELRFAIDNGRTLCQECHKTTETFLLNRKI